MSDREYIISLLQSNAPFFIGRIAGVELQIAYQYQHRYPDVHFIQELENNAGIYVKDRTSLLLYVDMLVSSYDHCTAIAEWSGSILDTLQQGQEFIQKRTPSIPKIQAPSLEPYYTDCNWMPALYGKRILIIHPFVHTIGKQLSHLSELFPGKAWFPSCKFIYCAPPVTLAGNHGNIDWKIRYDECIEMIDRITDYDIALVAAGGYGMLISDFLFTKKKKQVMYIGGALQLFFGIIGKRWFENKEVMALVNDSWVRPNKERVANCTRVEKGCYW